MIFDCEEIHKVRLEMAAEYSKMTKEEASLAFKRRAESARQAIEEIRRQRQEPMSAIN